MFQWNRSIKFSNMCQRKKKGSKQGSSPTALQSPSRWCAANLSWPGRRAAERGPPPQWEWRWSRSGWSPPQRDKPEKMVSKNWSRWKHGIDKKCCFFLSLCSFAPSDIHPYRRQQARGNLCSNDQRLPTTADCHGHLASVQRPGVSSGNWTVLLPPGRQMFFFPHDLLSTWWWKNVKKCEKIHGCHQSQGLDGIHL